VSLICDIFRVNLVNDTGCVCGWGIEDVFHFFSGVLFIWLGVLSILPLSMIYLLVVGTYCSDSVVLFAFYLIIRK
jgi:hypothetical protein